MVFRYRKKLRPNVQPANHLRYICHQDRANDPKNFTCPRRIEVFILLHPAPPFCEHAACPAAQREASQSRHPLAAE